MSAWYSFGVWIGAYFCAKICGEQHTDGKWSGSSTKCRGDRALQSSIFLSSDVELLKHLQVLGENRTVRWYLILWWSIHRSFRSKKWHLITWRGNGLLVKTWMSHPAHDVASRDHFLLSGRPLSSDFAHLLKERCDLQKWEDFRRRYQSISVVVPDTNWLPYNRWVLAIAILGILITYLSQQ